MSVVQFHLRPPLWPWHSLNVRNKTQSLWAFRRVTGEGMYEIGLGVQIPAGQAYRKVAQLGRALGLGPRGCRFKSCLSDHLDKDSLNDKDGASFRWARAQFATVEKTRSVAPKQNTVCTKRQSSRIVRETMTEVWSESAALVTDCTSRRNSTWPETQN